jgi:hypothetical protein
MKWLLAPAHQYSALLHCQGHSKPVIPHFFRTTPRRGSLLTQPLRRQTRAIRIHKEQRAAEARAIMRTESCSASASSPDSPRLAAAVLSVLLLCAAPCTASRALEGGAQPQASSAAPTPVYFGNGCFWGRQFDFVEQERAMGRAPEQVSAVVGYAGGKRQGVLAPLCMHCMLWSGRQTASTLQPCACASSFAA